MSTLNIHILAFRQFIEPYDLTKVCDKLKIVTVAIKVTVK